MSESNFKVWIRDDGYHDDFPVTVYNQDGFIERRFPSEEDAAQWISICGFKLQQDRPPGLRKDAL